MYAILPIGLIALLSLGFFHASSGQEFSIGLTTLAERIPFYEESALAEKIFLQAPKESPATPMRIPLEELRFVLAFSPGSKTIYFDSFAKKLILKLSIQGDVVLPDKLLPRIAYFEADTGVENAKLSGPPSKSYCKTPNSCFFEFENFKDGTYFGFIPYKENSELDNNTFREIIYFSGRDLIGIKKIQPDEPMDFAFTDRRSSKRLSLKIPANTIGKSSRSDYLIISYDKNAFHPVYNITTTNPRIKIEKPIEIGLAYGAILRKQDINEAYLSSLIYNEKNLGELSTEVSNLRINQESEEFLLNVNELNGLKIGFGS